MVECNVLRFGDFTLKSGRRAPYFVNTGMYRTGAQIARLGEYYAECYMQNKIDCDVLVGPAYKGIPLAVSTAIALARTHGVDVGFCFDRKEAKDHGEGGLFVGKPLSGGDRVTIVEDVMTSGKALREIMPKLKQEADVTVGDMLLSLDRCEKGTGEVSAIEEAYEQFRVRVHSIATIYDVIAAIEDGIIGGREYLQAMKDYLAQYGAVRAEK